LLLFVERTTSKQHIIGFSYVQPTERERGEKGKWVAWVTFLW